MSTVLSRNGKVLTANNKALTHQSGDVNVQVSKSYTVSASGSQTVSPDTGYDAMGVVSLTVPAGSATPASTISSTGASVSTGTNTITLSKSAVASTPVVSAGYISTGTQGNSSVSLTASVNTKGATTYTPTTTNQTIASGTYLTGTQTIVGDANLLASNIKKDVTIFNTTGSYEGSGGGGNLQPVKEYTVSASGNQTISPDTGYDGIEEVALIVPQGAMGTPEATKGTVSNHSMSISPSVINSDGWITGGTITGLPISVSASELVSGTYTVDSSGTKDVTNYESISVPAGTATAPASISGSSASVSTGTNTLTLSKTVSVTPNVSTAGYISSGTAGNSSVSLTASVTTKGATTYHPSTTDQTISSGTYLTGTQTIKGVTISGLSADNIVSGVTVKIGDSTDDDCVASVTGTASGGGYFTVTDTTDTAGGTIRTITPTEGTAIIQASKSVTINSNTTTTITPDTGNTALGQVVVTTDVSGGGGDSNPVAGEKDVNFIDYDGTIRYSYTATEFANLSSLPANPTHTGLTTQGWNWTLADAKSYVSTYGKHCIGQNYVTDDGKTRVYVNLDANSLNPYIGLGVNGTVSIDWGDGSSLETVTGSSTVTTIYRSHTYSAIGKYIIKFTPTTSSTYYRLSGNGTAIDSGAYLIRAYSSSTYETAQYARTIYKIELGSNIYLDDYALANLRSLEEITIPTSIINSSATGTLSGTGSYAFYYTQSLKCIVVPPGFTTTGGNYCQYSGISKISLPKSITTLSTYTFGYCYTIRFVAIPPNVNRFQSYVFNYCYQLKSVGPAPYRTDTSGSTFPSYFFNYNYCLHSYAVPSGVTILDSYVFQQCVSLKSITLPSGLVTIGNYAFAYCRSLPSISIPTTVTTINTYAFHYCQKLTSITTSATSIGTYAFANCSSLASVTLNGNLTTLSNYLFHYCSALPTVNIPSTVTSIGTYVFRYSGITSITVPANVTSIGTFAFADCTSLAEIHFLGTTTTPTFGSSCFSNLPTTCKIYVPTGYKSTYQGKTNAPSSSTYTWIEE